MGNPWACVHGHGHRHGVEPTPLAWNCGRVCEWVGCTVYWSGHRDVSLVQSIARRHVCERSRVRSLAQAVQLCYIGGYVAECGLGVYCLVWPSRFISLAGVTQINAYSMYGMAVHGYDCSVYGQCLTEARRSRAWVCHPKHGQPQELCMGMAAQDMGIECQWHG
jgi:hypothetical protein